MVNEENGENGGIQSDIHTLNIPDTHRRKKELVMEFSQLKESTAD